MIRGIRRQRHMMRFNASHKRDWKKKLYAYERSRHYKRLWKDPKAGLRRKRYYKRNLNY